MTYDELLAMITPTYERFETSPISILDALQAVVELHKPTDRYFPNMVWGQDGEIDMGGETRSTCKCDSSLYPCPTIQDIEKKLYLSRWKELG